MSNPKKIRHVSYRKYLDKRIPLVSYDLYEDENRKYAFLTFNNSTNYRVNSFKLKITFYTSEHDGLNTLYFKFDTPMFYAHRTYSPKEPLLFPKNADGFNYEILEVDTPSNKIKNSQSLRILGVPKDFVPSNRFVKGSNKSMAKPHWIPCVAILGCSILASVPYLAINISRNIAEHVENSYLEVGLQFNYDGLLYEVVDGNNGVAIVGSDNNFISEIHSQIIYPANPDITCNVIEIRSFAFVQCEMNSLGIYGKEEYPIIIRSNAFIDCNSLYKMNFNYCIIESYAFQGGALDTINLNLCTIYQNAFTSCYNLKYIYISKDVEFENYAFPDDAYIEYM